MSAKQGLGYPILQTIMQYLEANQRIELVRRCPCLKFVDKATPLIINHLFLSDSTLTINNAAYDIGVLRHYPKSHHILKDFLQEANSGGAMHDVDQFGRRDWSHDKILGPGDVVIENAFDDDDERERTPEEEIEIVEEFKQRLAYLKTLRRMKKRQEEIERLKAYLYTWQLSQDNALPPYKLYLMYARNRGDTKQIQYFEYSKKMYEGMKHLNRLFLEGRKCPVVVNTLRISDRGGVLRLPQLLKIRARQILMGTNVGSVMKSIGHLLVSTPRYVIITGGTSFGTNFLNPFLKSTDFLMLNDLEVTGDLFHTILEDSHSELWVTKGKVTNEEYIQLIEKMVGDKRPISTYCAFGVHSKAQIKNLLNAIKQRPGVITSKYENRGCSRFPFYYNLPIDDKTCLSVYCNRSKKDEPWTLFLDVSCRISAESWRVGK